MKVIDSKVLTETLNKIKEIFVSKNELTAQISTVQFKIEGSPAALKVSLDGGSTWQTVTLS